MEKGSSSANWMFDQPTGKSPGCGLDGRLRRLRRGRPVVGPRGQHALGDGRAPLPAVVRLAGRADRGQVGRELGVVGRDEGGIR